MYIFDAQTLWLLIAKTRMSTFNQFLIVINIKVCF